MFCLKTQQNQGRHCSIIEALIPGKLELIKQGKLLQQINYPDDLRKLSRKDLPVISNELRQFIVDSVSVYGGHFGASLGVVELTVALHYVFNTPEDQLIWDVGHQNLDDDYTILSIKFT